jgi:hypothetical protein
MKFVELIAAGVFVAAWVFAAQAIPTLPAQIPTHFRWNGVADQMGSPASLWMLPIIVTAFYLVLTGAQFMPSRWMNYPVKITEKNREAVYALGRAMLPAIKVGTLLIMFGIEWATIDAARRGAMGPFFMGAVFAPAALLIGILLYYTLKMRAA